MGASSPAVLRPLGVGEIIDRALTLYVRNVVLFTATVLVVIFIPLGAAQYLLFADQGSQIQALIHVFQHPGVPLPPSAAWPFAATATLPALVVGIAMLVAAAFLAPFANNAVAVNVASLYAGRRPSIGASLAVVFARWVPLVGLILLEILIVVAAYIALTLLLVGIVFGIIAASIAVAGVARSVLIAVLVALVSLALAVTFVALALLFVIALAFAGYAVVIEKKGATAALGSGFGRVFNRKEWGKAAVIGLVAILLSLGVSGVSAAGGLALAFVPGSHVLETIWNTLVAAVSASVQTVFYAVYYYDVRIRREGFDLEVALERLAPPAP